MPHHMPKTKKTYVDTKIKRILQAEKPSGNVNKRLRRGYCPYPIRLGSHVLIAGT